MLPEKTAKKQPCLQQCHVHLGGAINLFRVPLYLVREVLLKNIRLVVIFLHGLQTCYHHLSPWIAIGVLAVLSVVDLSNFLEEELGQELVVDSFGHFLKVPTGGVGVQNLQLFQNLSLIHDFRIVREQLQDDLGFEQFPHLRP